MALHLTLSQARRSLAARQGLGRILTRPLVERVASIGWIPAASPATAPVALHARHAWPGRERFAAAVARGDLQVVPGPHGATWIVPAAEAPLARAFALADHASREARIASACDVTARDLLAARDALRRALETPATPRALAARLDPATLRPLGPPGRRVGLRTLAALALRSLWAHGEVTRTPLPEAPGATELAWHIDPRPRVVPTAADAVALVAPRWLAAHAPVSARDFALAFGIAAGRAAAALKPLRPLEVRVETLDEILLAPPDFLPIEAVDPGPVFLPAGDPLTGARAWLSLLCDAPTDFPARRHGGHPPLVLVAGEAIARWSYDAGRVAVRADSRIPADAVAALEEFLLREVGREALFHSERPPRSAAPLDGDLPPRA